MNIKSLPDCCLIEILKEKIKLRRDINFDFLGKLDDFRKLVSSEVRYINEIFPEYTPHDEEYHLKRLFHVADTVLGKERLESMRSVELFVLALSLYGHDWGMAVSSNEKEYIIDPEKSEAKPEDFWILPDEHNRFKIFLNEYHLIKDLGSGEMEIPKEIWAEYVRRTHAFRSGERIRRYFNSIDRGLGEAVSRVCEGHWLDFEKLQDYKMYPVDFSVLRETINLRAISVYLRLVDLLDLAEDRTPYVIWKFVAPRNSKSKMEWAKHRALQPITCPTYQEGRVVRVDGSTDDHEVYAALEDLRIWCEEQLKGSSDTLSLMNDPRHMLDLYHIDWRVVPRGFEPVSIQFEFNRNRMFEILGNEIYQSDPYVFLRELLQNSIDAIRMRRAVLERNGISLDKLGTIRVEVQHGENGDAVVNWIDDGIGMNEYVIRNYLATAGNSYYNSADFDREDLKIDPISKFGIGILSSFMVADRLEIATYREPYMSPSEQPLKIVIPSMMRQFRIEKGAIEGAKVGTSIKVFIDGRKIPKDTKENKVEPLNITEYLSKVAGFVEFPILITEGIKKTIILHPKGSSETISKIYGDDFKIQKLYLGHVLSQVILPQDLKIADDLLKEQIWDIGSDLKLEGYEGAISFLTPKSFMHDFVKDYSNRGNSYRTESVSLIERKAKIKKSGILRWYNDLPVNSENKAGVSNSSSFSPLYSVYRDGILISSASEPVKFHGRFGYGSDWLYPRIVINIPKSIAPKIDLARREILEEKESWDSPVYQQFVKKIIKPLLKDLLDQAPLERLYRLGHISSYYRIDNKVLWSVFPHKKWPVPFLDSAGKLKVIDWGDYLKDEIYLMPDFLTKYIDKLFFAHYFTNNKYKGLLTGWVGEMCLISKAGYFETSLATKRAMSLAETPIDQLYYFDGIRFLESPRGDDAPIYQKVFIKRKGRAKLPDDGKILLKASKDPLKLNSAERSVLYEKYFSYKFGFSFPEFVNFPEPFDKVFGYGLDILNFSHLSVQLLVKCIAVLELNKRSKSLSGEWIGKLEDSLNALFRSEYGRKSFERFARDYEAFWALVNESKLIEIKDIKKLIPSHNEFVEGTVFLNGDKQWIFREREDDIEDDSVEFGKSFSSKKTRKIIKRVN